MERKMNVADFAALVGTTSKTIYQKIAGFNELPVNEQLLTVKEKVRGREVALILTNDEQISFYKSLYGKDNVNTGKYYETLTENNRVEPVNNVNKPIENRQQSFKTLDNTDFNLNIWNQFVTVNNEYNERYERKINELIAVNNELAEVKGRQLLLEDKAGREGLYINEINQLKTENNRQRYCIYGLVSVVVLLLLGLTGYITYNIAVNKLQQPILETQKEPIQVVTPAPARKK